ncbi:MAG: TIGR01777 family oxidoreductase [Opitutaceae bacterium]|nr:TIGR01777 family oxidoreductase [Opitutaceae bacterium]
MKIVVAGASGLIGSALVPALRAAGHEVHRLVRRAAASADEIAWDPAAGTLDDARFAGMEAVVNLAGENVGAGRWTARRRQAILGSRVEATRTLVAAMRRAASPPKVLVNASAVGFYGDTGDTVLTESAPFGSGFLPEVCVAWERETDAAAAMGTRVARLRFGVVLAAQGGALAKMLPIFRLGLGGRVGSGRQWMSWVSLEDGVRAIVHVVAAPGCVGAVNVVAPEPATNAQFTAALGRALRRPTVLPVPAWALRIAFGAMANETVLASQRAVPATLVATGFVFREPEIGGALREELGGKREADRP